jgi:transposase
MVEFNKFKGEIKMKGKTILNNHLTVDELEDLYLSCTDPVEKTHYQIIWLISQGKTAVYASEATGVTNVWISKLVKRYNENGISALVDGRHTNPGGKFILSNDQKEELKIALLGPSPDGGLWNSRKVTKWIEEQVSNSIGKATGGRYFKYLGFSLKSLRPKHLKSATPEEKEEFKKNLMRKWMK